MPYLIDGHNLIPKLGLSLRNVDDEMALIARLQTFCRVTRKSADVYFDGAPPGQVGTRKMGQVTAHFVRSGKTADDAIRDRLNSLRRAARNWTVVTSDRQVQANARHAGAAILTSDAFAKIVLDAKSAPSNGSTHEKNLPTEEVEEWMKIFRENKR